MAKCCQNIQCANIQKSMNKLKTQTKLQISMNLNNKFVRQKHKTRFADFLNSLMINKQRNNSTPEKQTIRHEENLLRTKTMKKPNPFLGVKTQRDLQNSSESSICSDILNQLASYMKQKNSQIPCKKHSFWQQLQVNSKQFPETYQNSKTPPQITRHHSSLFNSPTYFAKKKKKNLVNNNKTMNENTDTDDKVDDFEQQQKTESIINDESSKTLKLSKKASIENSQDNQFDSILEAYFRKKTQQGQKRRQTSQSSQIIVPKLLHRKKMNFINEDDKQFFQPMHGMNSSRKKKSWNNQKSNNFGLNKEELHDENENKPLETSQKKKKRTLQIFESIFGSQEKSSSNISKTQFTNTRRSSWQKFNRLKKQSQDQSTCSICIDEIKQRAKLPCMHSFCKQCLSFWLEKNSKCPNCRKDADHFICNGEKFEIQPKQFELVNYVNNIGDDSDQDNSNEVHLNYMCENCDETLEGDELLVCDRCFVNASHYQCDSALKGRMPPDHRSWYCNVCRISPNRWHTQKPYD